MATNDFLPFADAATDPTVVMPQATYAAWAYRPAGFPQGETSRAGFNKALRQANAITAAVAQAVVDSTGTDLLDNGDDAAQLAAIKAALLPNVGQTATVAGLASIATTRYAAVVVTGYAADGDCPTRVFWGDNTDSTTPANGINCFVSADGKRWKWKPPAEGVDIRFTGAVSGTSDSGAKINALLQLFDAIVPAASFYSSITITVPAGRVLRGFNGTSDADSGTSEIVFAVGVADMVVLDGGAGSASCGLEGIFLRRDAGAVPALSGGVHVVSSDRSLIRRVVVSRSAYGFNVSGQLGTQFEDCDTTQITTAHVNIENAVETNFTNCRFGRNGGLDVACDEYVRLAGTGVDTTTFTRCQFNQSAVPCTRGFFFDGYSNGNGIVSLQQCHMENVGSPFVQGGSLLLKRLSIDNCTINGTPTNQLLTVSAGTIQEFTLTGCPSISFALTLDQQQFSGVANNHILGPVSVNQGSGNISGNRFGSTVSLTGAMTVMVFAVNTLETAAAFTDSSTGQVSIFGNATADGTVNNALIDRMPGGYLWLSGYIPEATKRLVGALDGSGAATIAHGVTAGQYLINEAHAWYEGGSGEMHALNIVSIDGVNVSVSGGGSGSKYRVVLRYTDAAHGDTNW